MSIKGVMDAWYTTRFIDLLKKPFRQWDAYKRGIIDDKGNLLRYPRDKRDRDSYTRFHAMIRSLKQSIQDRAGSSFTAGLSIKLAFDALTEEYGTPSLGGDPLQIAESLVASDSGGDSDMIARGETEDGNIVSPGPETKKKRKLKKKVDPDLQK